MSLSINVLTYVLACLIIKANLDYIISRDVLIERNEELIKYVTNDLSKKYSIIFWYMKQQA